MVVQICDLPEEVMINIFKLLNADTVKEAALVCSDWNRVIGTTQAIMKKFILRVRSFSNAEEFKQLMTLERHFVSADISDIFSLKDFEKSPLIDVVEQFGKHLINFRLTFESLTSQAILNLVKQMPELVSLILIGPISNTDIPDADPVRLKKLKILEIDSVGSFFRLIETPELMRLTVEAPDDYCNIFESFLKALPKLKHLKGVDLDLFENTSPEFPFQLETLWCCSSKLSESAKKFLLSQAATVMDFDADFSDSELYEIILSKFEQLTDLYFVFRELTVSEKIYNSLKPKPYVTEIVSSHGFPSDLATRAILGNCPNLDSLDCLDDINFSKHLDFIAEHNRELTSLKVWTIGVTNARFEWLYFLTVQTVENGDLLSAFLKANQTISSLDICYLADDVLSDESLDALINETGLKRVDIEVSSNKLGDWICKKVQRGNGTWKSLKITRVVDIYSTEIFRCMFSFDENADERHYHYALDDL